MGLITWIKLRALNSAVDNLSPKEIVDVIEDFGRREFKDEKDQYLEVIRRKLANIIFEIGGRMGKIHAP